MTLEERIKRLKLKRDDRYWMTDNGVKVGDLVRFTDISSGSSADCGHFSAYDGKIGVIVARSTSQSGNPMATIMIGEFKDTFNVRFFEVIND